MPIDKIADPVQAAGAYAQGLKVGQLGVHANTVQTPSFGDMMRTAAQDSIETLRKSEKISADAVLGQANLADVVSAVTAAEATLQMTVAVRDRMIAAYQEILRMPI